jgi:hypothetical protein
MIGNPLGRSVIFSFAGAWNCDRSRPLVHPFSTIPGAAGEGEEGKRI